MTTPTPAPLTDGGHTLCAAIADVLRRYGLEPDGVLDAAACDVERVWVADRKRLAAELAEARAAADQLRYERRLLGACRRHLDEIADPEGRYTAEAVRTAGDLAQRIVDEIGHSVTDEPALGPSFREQIVELTAALAEATRLADRRAELLTDVQEDANGLSDELRELADERDQARAELAAARQAPWMVQDGGDWYLNHAHPAIEKLRAILAVDGDSDYALDVLVRWGDALAAEPPASSGPTPDETARTITCRTCGPVPYAEIHLLTWDSPHGDERCTRCGGGDLDIPTPGETEEPPAQCDATLDLDDNVTRYHCVRNAEHDGAHWSRSREHEWLTADQVSELGDAEPVSAATGDTQDDAEVKPCWNCEGQPGYCPTCGGTQYPDGAPRGATPGGVQPAGPGQDQEADRG